MNDTAYISSISHLRMCFDIQWVISSLQQTCWEHGTNIPYPIFLWRKLRMQRSKQIFPKSHSRYRGSLDSNLHRLDSKAYDHSTLTCCLAWDKNPRGEVTCPWSHNKTALLGLNSTNTPRCILSAPQTSSSPSPPPFLAVLPSRGFPSSPSSRSS